MVLFIPSKDFLKLRLQLDAIEDGGAVDSLLTESTEEARIRLLQSLTADQRSEILSRAYTETPADLDAARRNVAVLLELDMIRAAIYDRLRTVIANGVSGEYWNQVQPLLGAGNLATRILEVEQRIERNLHFLNTGVYLNPGDNNFSSFTVPDDLSILF